MDQLKPILAGIKKYHFWILAVTTTVLAVGVWYMVTSDLKSVMEQQKQTVDSQYSSVTSVRNERPLPNQHSHDKMDAIVAESTRELAAAWQKQYDEQRKVLVWPAELTDEFISVVDPLRPIEKAIPYDPNATPPTDPKFEIAPRFRELYQNYIEALLPSLADSVGAKWKGVKGSSGSGLGYGMPSYGESGDYSSDSGPTYSTGAMPGQQASLEPPPIVIWSSTNQSELLNKHFNWAQKPTTLEVLYAQETLWVLQSLLRVIQRTNGDIDARYQASIKDIDEILLGRPALGRRGQVTRPAAVGAEAGAYPGGEGGYMPEGPTGYEGMSDEGGGMYSEPGVGGAAVTVKDPAEGRYVDEKFEPLPADTLRSAIASDNRDPNNASVVVAKRMPVRLRLKMDQRKLSRLLAECGNAELPLEVRQVRINRTTGSTSSSMGMSYGSGGGFGESSDDSYSSSNPLSGYGEGGPSYGGGDAAARTVTNTSPFDIPIEIYGVVYIYNPVNIEKLGIDKIDASNGQGGEEPAADDAAAAPEPEAAAAAANAVPVAGG